MPGTLSRADLVADLKDSLHDAASIFTKANDGDFVRMLDIAARDMGRVRPRTQLGSLTLTAGEAVYGCPSDLLTYKTECWAIKRLPPMWDPAYPGRMPTVRLARENIQRVLVFDPAPTDKQISFFGSTFKFYYLAAHVIDDSAANTTINDGDRGLLLLRAQAEALREMAMRNIGKPMQLRDGMSQMPRNGTPGHLFTVLMDEFNAQAV